jgi:hypothetical protein
VWSYDKFVALRVVTLCNGITRLCDIHIVTYVSLSAVTQPDLNDTFQFRKTLGYSLKLSYYCFLPDSSNSSFGDQYTLYRLVIETIIKSVKLSLCLINWAPFIHQWLYRPLFRPWSLLQFPNLFYAFDRTPWTRISPSQGLYLHTGQHKHRINAHTDIHALSGIQTHHPSFRASEGISCLRPDGHCDRQLRAILWRHVGGGWRYSSTIHDLDTGWRWVVSFTPLLLCPRGKEPPVLNG